MENQFGNNNQQNGYSQQNWNGNPQNGYNNQQNWNGNQQYGYNNYQLQSPYMQKKKSKAPIIAVIALYIIFLIVAVVLAIGGLKKMLVAKSTVNMTGAIMYLVDDYGNTNYDAYWYFDEGNKVILRMNENEYYYADCQIYYDENAANILTDEKDVDASFYDQLKYITNKKNEPGYEHYVAMIFSNYEYYYDGELQDTYPDKRVVYMGDMGSEDDAYYYYLLCPNSANSYYFKQFKD